MTSNLFAKTEGTVLQNNATLWEKNESGVMAWGKTSASVPAGTILEADEDIVVATLKTSTKTYDNVEFYNVTYDGKSLYIQANRFSLGNGISIVTANSTLYTKAAVNTFRNAYLEPGTIVVNFGSYQTPLCNFAKIEFFDEQAYTVRTRFIKASNISSDKSDLKAVQILNKLPEAKDADIKKELIKSAASLNVSEGIKNLVDLKYNEIYGIADEESDAE